MNDPQPPSEAEQVRDILEKTVEELNRAVEMDEIAREQGLPPVLKPHPEPSGLNEYEMPPENQVPIAQLDEDVKKKLGVKVR